MREGRWIANIPQHVVDAMCTDLPDNARKFESSKPWGFTLSFGGFLACAGRIFEEFIMPLTKEVGLLGSESGTRVFQDFVDFPMLRDLKPHHQVYVYYCIMIIAIVVLLYLYVYMHSIYYSLIPSYSFTYSLMFLAFMTLNIPLKTCVCV